jgi:hypothetical protein
MPYDKTNQFTNKNINLHTYCKKKGMIKGENT